MTLSIIKYILTVSLILATGVVAAGTVTAGEQPIWHNFVSDTTLLGTLPGEERLTHTARIWQTQLEALQKANPPEQADHKASPAVLTETRPIWAEQCKCM